MLMEINVNALLKEIENGLEDFENEVGIVEEYAQEIRALKEMSISDAVIASEKIDFKGFSLHVESADCACGIVHINFKLICTVNRSKEAIAKIDIYQSKFIELIKRFDHAVSIKEEMCEYYNNIAKDFTS